METILLQCEICQEDYDLYDHCPRILTQCGHTACTYCLQQILERGSFECPFDRISFIGKKKKNDIEKLCPQNYSLKKIIAEKLKQEVCQIHGRVIEFADFQSKTKGCGFCVKKIEVESLEEVLLEIGKNRKIMEEAWTCFDKTYMQIEDLLLKGEDTTIQALDNHFERFITLIRQRQRELVKDLKTYFSKKKAEYTGRFGKESLIRKDFTSWKSKFEDAIHDKDPFAVDKEQGEKFRISCMEAFEDQSKKLSGQIDSFINTINEKVTKEIGKLTNSVFSLSVLSDQFNPDLNVITSLTSFKAGLTIKEVFKTSLQITFNGETLNIRDSTNAANTNVTEIDCSLLRKITRINFNLKNLILERNEISMLESIFSQLKEISRFDLKVLKDISQGPIRDLV